MRPIAIGRKNWIHVGSPQAGPKIAATWTEYAAQTPHRGALVRAGKKTAPQSAQRHRHDRRGSLLENPLQSRTKRIEVAGLGELSLWKDTDDLVRSKRCWN